MAFLNVIETQINAEVVRIYRNVEARLLANESAAQIYVKELIVNNFELFKGKKIVVILWERELKRMADLWIFKELESDNAGASISVYLFEEFERYESPVVTASDGLVVLGAEASELLRK